MLETKLDPAMQPGPGYYHRIDDIPPLYSTVSVLTTDGDIRKARVMPASDTDLALFSGMGADVKYDIIEDNGMTGATILLANGIAWIKEEKGG